MQPPQIIIAWLKGRYLPDTEEKTMYETKNDLSLEIREKMISLLNAWLVDSIDLQMQIKQAHWNVKGPNFIALHELFDDISERIEKYIDLLAERVTALGGTAEGTVATVAKHTHLSAYPLDIVTSHDHLEALARTLAAFGRLARAAITAATDSSDADTADLLTEISRGIDKDLWLIEAHLQTERLHEWPLS
jgi:starvation-inducible DNA-binding protein